MWLFLQSNWANSAAIFALALLPLVSLGSAALDSGSLRAQGRTDPVRLEQLVRQINPIIRTAVE